MNVSGGASTGATSPSGASFVKWSTPLSNGARPSGPVLTTLPPQCASIHGIPMLRATVLIRFTTTNLEPEVRSCKRSVELATRVALFGRLMGYPPRIARPRVAERSHPGDRRSLSRPRGLDAHRHACDGHRDEPRADERLAHRRRLLAPPPRDDGRARQKGMVPRHLPSTMQSKPCPRASCHRPPKSR